MLAKLSCRCARLAILFGVLTPLSWAADEPASYDVVVYGGTSGGVIAAVQAKKMGKTVVVVGPDKHLGGLSAGGLGFDYKWNMGWMHDTLRYVQRDPIHRRHHHGDMTFGLAYAFSEHFILPLSHDEVVHGKSALAAKMGGDPGRRLDTLRAYLAFMWAHPGKKLLFMGGEFGQRREDRKSVV